MNAQMAMPLNVVILAVLSQIAQYAPSFDMTDNSTVGFMIAKSTLGEADVGGHIEQRIKISVPSLRDLFKQRGLFSEKCRIGTSSDKQLPYELQGNLMYTAGTPATTEFWCWMVYLIPDKTWTRPPSFYKAKIFNFLGGSLVTEWSDTFNNEPLNMCLAYASQPKPFDIDTPTTLNTGLGVSATTQPPIPRKFSAASLSNLDDIRKLPEVDNPHFPSVIGRQYDASTMISSQYSSRGIDNKDAVIFSSHQVIGLALFPCKYETSTSAPFVDTGAAVPTTPTLKNSIIDIVPGDMGFDHILAMESKTVDEIMSAVPRSGVQNDDDDKMRTGEIVAISLGSVGILTAGIAIFLSTGLGRNVAGNYVRF
jgi:hypothetical protein